MLRRHWRGRTFGAVNEAPLNAPVSLDPRATPRRLRVVIADDDRDAVQTLSAILQDEGHEVRGVHDGDAVIDAISGFDPEVVVLDIGMPERTGYEVARYLRRRYGEQGVVLVAVTGWKKPSDKILAKLAGFDHHFAKPFDPQALVELLRTLPPGRT